MAAERPRKRPLYLNFLSFLAIVYICSADASSGPKLEVDKKDWDRPDRCFHHWPQSDSYAHTYTKLSENDKETVMFCARCGHYIYVPKDSAPSDDINTNS